MPKPVKLNRYQKIIVEIFKRYYKRGVKSFHFGRAEIEPIAKKLKIALPKNLGDIIYSFRYRNKFPDEIEKTASKGFLWSIEGAGRAKYRFVVRKLCRIIPRKDLVKIKIPDSTPEIIIKYAHTDEQALLAKVRYNRLIDIFLGITAYSLQSHLRATVLEIGQMEIDELYVGVNKNGQHFIVPVQAKAGNDELGSVQMRQDIAFCKQNFPELVCRAVAVQFLRDGSIAVFELLMQGEEIKVVEERHYELVPSDRISKEDLILYNKRS